jgi:tetratricopeptide (TPR) repeat protein
VASSHADLPLPRLTDVRPRATTGRTRSEWFILGCAWGLAAVLLYLHSAAYRVYVDRLDAIALRGGTTAATPMQRICPDADAQMWARNAIALSRGEGPQLRSTHADNAPLGREVHWDSGLAWLIAGAGWLEHVLTGVSWPNGIERALSWLNLPLMLGFVVFLSAAAMRWAGVGAGVFTTFAMIGNEDFYSGFSPNFVDHHGVLSSMIVGLVLGAAFMGGGFHAAADSAARLLPRSVRAVRRAAAFSAGCGAIGMWVSAPTLIPAIAMVGLAGLAAIFWFSGSVSAGETQLDPGAWRVWGAVGASLSLAFYLLEYAPHHLGFRLEVNHPFYAAAWWGGGELIAQLAEWRLGRRAGRTPTVAAAVAAGAILLAPATIAIGGTSVFVVFDPFVAQLSQYVAEGFSTAKAVALYGPERLWGEVPMTLAALGLGVVAWRRCRSASRAIVTIALGAALPFTAMAAAQIRWWPSAAAAQIALMVVAFAALADLRSKWIGRGVAFAAIVGLGVYPMVARISRQFADNRRGAIDRMDAVQPLYRDIAAVLRASQPQGDIVVLASPNASASIGYYGQFQTIGTLYWENLAGTKAAAAMLAAQSADQARRLMRERGVTHVVLLSEEHFLAEYFALLHPDADATAWQKSFGVALLTGRDVPLWLEPIPYDVPSDSFAHPQRIALYRTRFNAPAAEARYDAAIQAFERGDGAAAGGELDAALAVAPGSAELWLAKAQWLLGAGDPAAALQAVGKSVACAAPAQRFGLWASAANGFRQIGALVEAATLCRRALALQFEPTIANNLVWLLATCRDDRVRNGPEALAFAERLAPGHPEFPFLSAHAAALAECGRFADAAALADRAIEVARAAGNSSAADDEGRRFAAYREARAWRQ